MCLILGPLLEGLMSQARPDEPLAGGALADLGFLLRGLAKLVSDVGPLLKGG